MRRPASSGIRWLDIKNPKGRQEAVVGTKDPGQKRREASENLPELIVNETDDGRYSPFVQRLDADPKRIDSVQGQDALLVHVSLDANPFDEKFYGRKDGLRKITTALDGQVRAKLPPEFNAGDFFPNERLIHRDIVISIKADAILRQFRHSLVVRHSDFAIS
jgi:hypothetical protein